MLDFDYQIVSTAKPLPEDLQQNIDRDKTSFFQNHDFILHQGSSTYYVFNGRSKDTGDLMIQIKFAAIERQLISLPRCPFGGFILKESITASDISSFLNSILDQVKNLDIKSLIIKQPAEIYDSAQSMLVMGVLKDYLIFTDINQHIRIPDYDPEESLHKMQQRRVVRCLDQNFSFKHERVSEAEEIHDFISASRKNQGIIVNIDFDHFLSTIKGFPYHYDLFTIRDNQKIIAATVTVKVNNKIVYNYLPASDRSYSRYSPMVFLITKVIEHYNFKKYEIFDLGVSSIEGIAQENLRGFKKRIGGQETGKDVFEIRI